LKTHEEGHAARSLEIAEHPLLAFETGLWNRGARWIAGIDEAGRGPLAGPVVAAAVMFSRNTFIEGVRDSKQVREKERERLFDEILSRAAAVGVGTSDEKTVDRINILQATYEAMRAAVSRLSMKPDHLLVDGRALPAVAIPQTAIVRGDGKSFSIAAASIVAKVTRDRIMAGYDLQYPQYGFSRHKGYSTRAHVLAIREFGYCDLHRRSFRLPEW
jgi:ribonuclease HII